MNCAEGYPRPLGFWNLLKVTYRLNILGILLRPHLDHWIFFTKQCILFEGPLYKRYGLACTSMGCVIVTVSSFPPSLPPSLCLLGGQGSFALPCAALFAFDCGKISQLSVRVPRSLDRLFPWGGEGGVLCAQRCWAPLLLQDRSCLSRS